MPKHAKGSKNHKAYKRTGKVYCNQKLIFAQLRGELTKFSKGSYI